MMSGQFRRWDIVGDRVDEGRINKSEMRKRRLPLLVQWSGFAPSGKVGLISWPEIDSQMPQQ